MGNDISIVRGAAGAAAAFALALAGCAIGPEPIPEMAPVADTAPTLEAVPTESIVAAEPASDVRLEPNAPLRYVVKKGDTLWAIANTFLKDSWQWPELWYVNPDVRNPHLIYPGDELYLYYVNGAPRLARAGEGEPGATGPAAPVTPAPVETLPPGGLGAMTPTIREQPLDLAVYSIPLEAIRGFLRGPRLVDEDELDDAPYVVDFEDEHIIAAADNIAYVLDLENTDITQYQVVRRGQEYRDPDDNDVIGYEALPVADAEVRVFGDPATIYLRRSDMETRAGDYLLPLEQDPLALRFVPHAPSEPVGGKIIAVYNGLSQIGQYQVIAINRGTEHGMEPGHVLSVIQSGRTSKDPYSFFGSSVQLPDIKAGTVMVFKTAPRLSYALVMDATRAIHILDAVEKPEPSR